MVMVNHGMMNQPYLYRHLFLVFLSASCSELSESIVIGSPNRRYNPPNDPSEMTDIVRDQWFDGCSFVVRFRRAMVVRARIRLGQRTLAGGPVF